MTTAIYRSDSKDKKLAGNARVDATYASLTSCPDSCAWKHEGCYAKYPNVIFTAKKLDKFAKETSASALQIALDEAKAIDSSYGGQGVPMGRQLRLHVSGDCTTDETAKVLAKAIDRWIVRGGGLVWTYTHSWMNIKRESWGRISVLASIEKPGDAEKVMAMGYAPAIVVPEHPSDKVFILPGSNVGWIPCPAETRGVKCSDCGLCQESDKLIDRNQGIAFHAHGVKKGAVKRYLKVIQ
jgi:hypothetical protein